MISTMDPIVRTIVLANAATGLVALLFNWGVGLLMWPFWAQSVIIGLYSFLRMVEATRRGQGGNYFQSVFFLIHYGGFHAAYLFFLMSFAADADSNGMVPITNESSGEIMQFYVGTSTPVDFVLIGLLSLMFWWAHRKSYQVYLEADLDRRPGFGSLMSIPYLRILPMHLTIIFGALIGDQFALLLFVVLKTMVDVLMHRFEHRWLSKA